MRKVTWSLTALSVFAVFLFAVSLTSADTMEGKIPITTQSQEALKHYLEGRDLAEALRGPQARTYFEKAVTADPNFGLAHLQLALVQPTAKGFFEHLDEAKALADKVSDGERMMIQGLVAGNNAEFLKQREIYKSLVTAYPNDERAHTLLGTHYFGQQDYETAIQEYTKAIEINPNFSAPYNQLGYSYRFVKKYDEAEKAFKKYIELIPDDPNPYDSYAELLMKIGRYEESITNYRKALEIDPTFVASYIGIATNLNFLGRHEEARAELQKMYDGAIDDGQRRQAHFAMAVSYTDEGKMDMAVGEIKKMTAIAEKINYYAAMSGDQVVKGNIHLEAGQPDQALTCYRKAVTLIEKANVAEEVKETTRRTASYNEARVALAQNDIETAQTKSDEYATRVTVLNNPNEVRLMHQLKGMVALQQKDFQTAHANLLKSNQQNPQNIYRMAVALDGQGDKAKAKEICQEAASFNQLNSLNQAFAKHKAKRMMAGM
ncbi:MAG: tetratricopeptide repeat protein [Candidatus Zixiibacteriota bacterium]|nr:MAG: tetratricopeptide repeat protein [candidate division Zixibacteria bacterium]